MPSIRAKRLIYVTRIGNIRYLKKMGGDINGKMDFPIV